MKSTKKCLLVVAFFVGFLVIVSLPGSTNEEDWVEITAPTSFVGWFNDLSLLPAITLDYNAVTPTASDLFVSWDIQGVSVAFSGLSGSHTVAPPEHGTKSLTASVFRDFAEGKGDILAQLLDCTEPIHGCPILAGDVAVGIFGLDATPPRISLISPVDGASYTLNEEVFTEYAVEDALSGVENSSGTSPNNEPIDTSTPGDHTFTVQATDRAGNNTSVSVTYRVLDSSVTEQTSCSKEAPYADAVSGFNPGPHARPDLTAPFDALGPPDYSSDPVSGVVSLGIDGSITLAFVKIDVIDGPGADLKIWGDATQDEFIEVAVSEDGEEYQAFENVVAETSQLDLSAVGLKRIRFIRITDDGSEEEDTAPGAEIDAVEALHCQPN